MKMKINFLMKRHLYLLGFICGLLLVSCKKLSKTETQTKVGDYKAPETVDLKFSDPISFEWEPITADSIITPKSYPLNVDALDSKPFELNQFRPLKKPIKTYDLDWNNLPSEKLTFDSIPFTVRKTPLKKPKISNMRGPGILKETNVNLMQLSTMEGLAHNEISSMLETDNGATWISGPQSISLYDGETIITYDYPNVFDMALDNQGRLWIATFQDGLYILDFKQKTTYSIELASGALPLVDMLYDQHGHIYLASFRDAFYTIDTSFERFQKITNKGSNMATTLFEDSKNNIWLTMGEGIAMIDKDRKQLIKIPQLSQFSLGFISDIKEDTRGSIWFTSPSNQSVLAISPHQNKVSILTEENGYTLNGTRLEVDTKGDIWIAGNNQVYILNKDLTSTKSIMTNSNMMIDKRGSTLKRKDGSIWIGTLNRGVLLTNKYTLNTEYFDVTRGLLGSQVWDIEEDSRGEIWLATDKGINIINPQNKSIKSLSFNDLHIDAKNNINHITALSNDLYFWDNRVGFTIYDRQKHKITQYAHNLPTGIEALGYTATDAHTFYLFTPEGLFVYDTELNTLKKLTFNSDTDNLITMFGVSMIYDGKDILYIPTQTKGLAKVNLENHTIQYLSTAQGLCDNRAGVATLSDEGELWLTTHSGIAILNLKENTLTNIKEENGLIPAEMYDLIERNNTMYAASVNGLIPINKSTAKNTVKGFYNLNAGFGFKSNDYLSGSSKFLKNGQFWAGAVNLSDEYRLLIMNTEPEIDSTQSVVHIKNMFVMDEAISSYANTTANPLYSENSTSSQSKDIQWDSISKPYNLPVGLELPYDQNSLSFSYASGDVFNRGQLAYRFILDGEDKDWTYANTQTKTKNYYNLKPGQYTFKVASRSFNKQWSTPAVLSFRINPPWWQTWWAYVLFGILIASILRIYIVFRARKLTRENRILEQNVKERTKELEVTIADLKATQSQLIQSEKMASLGELTAGIAHEIQNPLNFVNNFSEVNIELIDEMQEELKAGNQEEVIEISNDIKENQKKITHHGKRADSIVKGMLKHSRNTSGEKEPTNINVLADEYLRLAYHGIRAKDKTFNATLNTDFDESIGLVNVAGQELGRVVLNLITNALHAIAPDAQPNSEGGPKQPTIWVSTKQKNKQIHIEIKDNGTGIPKNIIDKIFQPFFTTKASGQGTGLGLSMSYDIIKAHGGELTVESEQGKGTTFTIIIPK